MHDTWTHELETWHEFFLLIGTAGVTLTGLLFVVVSLGLESSPTITPQASERSFRRMRSFSPRLWSCRRS